MSSVPSTTARLAALALATGVASGLTAPAAACDGPRSIEHLADDAELVFRGVVQDVQYVMSEPAGPEQIRIPHTFVTYRVDDVLLGQDPGVSVTLRFIGGLDLGSMRYLAASTAPQFDLGDEDVLFVQGNTRSLVPLVHDQDGRMRVIDGQVYTETGREVTIEDDGHLRYGRRFMLDGVFTTNVAGRLFHHNPGPDLATGRSNAVRADAFVAALDALAFAGPKHPFVDADPGRSFFAPDMTPAAPPSDLGAEPARPADEDPTVDAERRRAALESRDGK